LGADGTAEIGRDELLRAFDEDLNFALMDFGDARTNFNGNITGRILSEEEVEKRIEAVNTFSKTYRYPSGYLDNLISASRTNALCDSSLNVSVEQIPSFDPIPDTPLRKEVATQPTPFPYQAAKGSWASAVIVFLLFVFSSAAARVPLEIIAFLLMFVGFCLGIAGLCGIKRHGWKGILIPSLVGLILNGLLLFIFGTNFFAARAAYGH
jgi:hypothetical protein